MDKRSLTVLGLGAVVAGITGSGILLWRYRKSARKAEGNPYETEQLVNEYMGLHYAPANDYVSYKFAPRDALDFPVRCAQLCKRHNSDAFESRALDIGCAVGRSTFELATVFEEVIGIDYAEALIRKANEMKENGSASYSLKVEGDIATELTATVDPSIDRSRVTFQVGDACALPSDIGKFGMVLAANLICRLPEPMAFFNRLKDLVVPAGILVITSPYTWLEQFTPKDRWIGGIMENDEEKYGFDTLKKILTPNFILLEEENMPFFIRETVRKHQWTVSHATVWMRKI